MPSGYTSDIYEGKEVTGNEFILKCARAFGAAILMRDEALNEEIRELEPSDYHLRQLENAKVKLNKYKSMTIDEICEIVEEDYNNAVVHYNKKLKEYNELENRYTKVLNEVEKWIPPTKDHIKLKEYAIDQLTQSIAFDCNQSYLKFPEKETTEKWLEMKIFMTEQDIKYHQEGWESEVKRTEERNQWVKHLKESLK